MAPVLRGIAIACAGLAVAVAAVPDEDTKVCNDDGCDDGVSLLAHHSIRSHSRAASAGQCCYHQCGSCNPPGHYCDSESTCTGDCHGSWLTSCQSGGTCYKAMLGPDPPTVPWNSQSAASSGSAVISVTSSEVLLDVAWHIPGVSLTDPVVGIHIHQGDSHTNGGILVGFCGGVVLPPFSGNCSQGTMVQGYQVLGMACDITGPDSPCVNTDGTGTIEEAAAMLLDSSDVSQEYYLNIHTMYSFNQTQGLGLIRGQLMPTSC